MITAAALPELIASVDHERQRTAGRLRLLTAGRRLARAEQAQVRAARRVDRAHATLGYLTPAR